MNDLGYFLVACGVIIWISILFVRADRYHKALAKEIETFQGGGWSAGCLPQEEKKESDGVSIHDLPRGSSGFTVPWCLATDRFGQLSIHDDYTKKIRNTPFGTSTLQVFKTPSGHIFIDVSRCDRKWFLGQIWSCEENYPTKVMASRGWEELLGDEIENYVIQRIR